MSNTINFEILCFDQDNKCPFENDTNKFASNLNSNRKLFSSTTQINSNTLKDGGTTVTLTLIDGNSTVDYKSAFLVNVQFNDVEQLEIDQFRVNLTSYLVTLQFAKIYVLKDDFSRKLLAELYSSFNELENILRSYVAKHMAIKEGFSTWLIRSINNKAKEGIRNRKKNENLFSIIDEDIIDTQVFLIDFEDLGDIIYSNSYGNQDISSLVDKIQSAENLDILKNLTKRSIDKYFASFKEVSFQDKWLFLKDVRNKIAHNGLISLIEADQAKSYVDELLVFINEKDNEVVKVEFSNFDIDRASHIDNIYQYKDISKNELLRELRLYKDWSDSIGRDFLSLKNFLHNRLGGIQKGYHIGKAWDKLEELENEGYIKISVWHDKTRQYPDQKEIKIIRDLPVFLI